MIGALKRVVADHLLPVIDGQLAGHEGGAAADAVLGQFEQIAPLVVTKGRKAPVVEDQEIGTRQRLHQRRVATIGRAPRQP
jgi:hypothetical protein